MSTVIPPEQERPATLADTTGLSALADASAGLSGGVDLPKHIKVNGHYIHLRKVQMIVWGLIIGLCAAAAVAGGYLNWLEVNWHVHIGLVAFQIFYLKHWWDGGMGFIHSASWFLYRHGVRDLGEPAAAVMVVKTAMAKPKYWRKTLGPVALVARVFMLLVVALTLILGGVWLLDFGLPQLGHILHWSHHIPQPAAAWETFVLGLAIGFPLHRIWAPAGATIQGALVDRSVDRAKLTGRTPLWYRLPLAPPVIRERFAWIWDHDIKIEEHGKASKWLVLGFCAVVAYFVVTGFIAHYWIGTGHNFPYLAP